MCNIIKIQNSAFCSPKARFEILRADIVKKLNEFHMISYLLTNMPHSML